MLNMAKRTARNDVLRTMTESDPDSYPRGLGQAALR